MIKVNDERDQINIAKVHEAGQEHIFRWWEDLTPPEKRNLLNQVGQIDFQLLSHLAKQFITSPMETTKIKLLIPPPLIRVPAPTEELKIREEESYKLGEELLQARKVVLFLSAGEMATPLGLDIPLGMVPIGPVSCKTLYEWHGEKIASLCERYKCSIPLIIMVSEQTEKQTLEFFEKKSYFGLSSADVRFVKQKMIPVLNKRGKIILKEKDSLCFSTNGYGGILGALQQNKLLEELMERGVEHLFYFQVENPLVKIADPLLLGYHSLEKAEISTKVVAKRSVEEKVEVASFIDGSLGFLIHSDLPEGEKNARTSEGGLTFNSANTTIHIFSLPFLRQLVEEGFQLPYHKIEKQTDYMSRRGEKVQPSELNSAHFKKFLCDILLQTEGKILVEVPRKDEYAPILEREGPFSPHQSQEAISAFFTSWFSQLDWEGSKIPEGCLVEITPKHSFDFETFREKLVGKI